MLASQWVNHPNLPLVDNVSVPKQSKKSHWFSRSRSIRRTGRDRNIEMSNLAPIPCNTKRASSIFAENFLYPIDMPNEGDIIIPTEQIQTVKTQKRSLFSGSLKKKIGPMEDMEKSKMFNRKNSSSNEIKAFDTSEMKNGSCSLETKPYTDQNNPYDEEQGTFIMAPTCTEDLTHLHHMEIEARFILQKLGISNDSLLRAIDSGPRSDIMGAYRIIIHRLQKQIWLNKQAELITNEEIASRPKSNRTCAIL